MDRQCQIVLGLTLTSLLIMGCVSVRHDEAALPPVRQDAPTLAVSDPAPTAPRKIPKPVAASPKPTPPEALPTPIAPAKPNAASQPKPIQPEQPTPAKPMAAKPTAKSDLSCGEMPDDCSEQPAFVWDLHHRLGGLLHWQRRAPAVPTVIPPRPKFHPVPTHPVFAQQAVFTAEAPRQLPSTMGKPLPPPVLDSTPMSDPIPMPKPMPSPTTTPTPVPPPVDVEPEASDRTAEVPRTINNEFRIASPIPLSQPAKPIDDSWHTHSSTPR
ncbi:hypothetical protein [Blastopirellula marina]|uniref:Uncharacterized protein n=1 Tax=Blastopirellula marina TaxID=124 RepID=A0A2S8GLE3_9BACT|nr:hypothetical protein [Blastopirellula marina]PQO45255.1 hypothetical protein C5Y93_14935 [Blastopirellula marina]